MDGRGDSGFGHILKSKKAKSIIPQIGYVE
jgi:hypothetical protein